MREVLQRRFWSRPGRGALALGVLGWLALCAPAAEARGRDGADGLPGGGGLPGAPGARGGDGPGPGLGRGAGLEERRARTRWLDEQRPPPTQTAPPTTPTPGGAPAAPEPPRGIVTLTHGEVRLVADLARVNLVLEVRNEGAEPLEWSHSYPLDPACEVIGAALRRGREAPVVARTLTLADARSIYAEIRNPRPAPPTVVPPRGGNSDPLRLERVTPERLDVSLWPIEPGETVRVELAFVTPLRGRGAARRFVDVLGGPDATRPEPLPREHRSEAPGEPPGPPRDGVTAGAAVWLIHPGELTLATAGAQGATLSGEVAGRFVFHGEAAVRPDQPRASVEFLDSRPTHARALAVPGGAHAAEVAIWWFDPALFLAARGYRLTPDLPLTLRLGEARGSATQLSRLAFEGTDPARPVTALLRGGGERLRFFVDVEDATGTVLETVAVDLPVERPAAPDADLKGTITAWHRAGLVHRVRGWAGDDPVRRAEAVRYAVDLGVLAPDSAALAVPARERGQLGVRSRRLYEGDGVPLGAQRREADWKQPPAGAFPPPAR